MIPIRYATPVWVFSGPCHVRSTAVARRPTFGVEPFDVGYGASFHAEQASPADLECPLVEDTEFTTHVPQCTDMPQRVAFIDGIMRTEARLTRMDEDGVVLSGLAGAWAAGAVTATADSLLAVEHVTHGRVAIFCGGQSAQLPAQAGGWAWDRVAVEDVDPKAAHDRLSRIMRDAEGSLAEQLTDAGWVAIVDGPLNNVRRTRKVPIVGYVKTHHRRMLAPQFWLRVPELKAGERSSIFAIGDECYASYLRVGDAGPWASPWAGIARIEVPSGVGRDEAKQVLDWACSVLPRYASSPHRDARAPVNLTPIAGLEQALRRYVGDAAFALRAVRAAILQMNEQEPQ